VEEIVSAAIKRKFLIFSMPIPARHNDIIHAMVDEGLEPPIVGAQGFLTNEGEFVTRTEAAEIAFNRGQISSPRLTLYSEDLW
jgi:hypothetical protein